MVYTAATPATRSLRRSLGCPAFVRIGLVGAMLALIAVLGGCGSGGSGDGLPLTLSSIDGSQDIEVGAPSETPRVVNLWATWCAPCRAELPDFDRVAAAAAPDVDVVGVNVGEDPDDAAAMVQELALSFDQYLDSDSDLSSALGVVSMPSTAFVDTEGSVVELHAGPLTASELADAIDEHLGVQVLVDG